MLVATSSFLECIATFLYTWIFIITLPILLAWF
jgi:hypothetical protein